MYQGQGHASTGELGRRPATYFRFFEITQPTAPAAGGNFTSYEFHRKQTVVEVALFLGPVSHTGHPTWETLLCWATATEVCHPSSNLFLDTLTSCPFAVSPRPSTQGR